MLRILRDKFIRLGRDENGVALVLTLAVFMFMYLFCMGVYAIGTAVKNRVHLQNACDAAAYSAAVVQADTLSRIATINRAMAWTYIAMTKRQMDYIVWKWLDHTKTHCDADASMAHEMGQDPICHYHPVWYVGATSAGVPPLFPFPPYFSKLQKPYSESNPSIVSLNGTKSPTCIEIGTHLELFKTTHFWDSSFYNGRGSGIQVLRDQISADKTTIKSMGEAIDDLLIGSEVIGSEGLPAKVKEAVDDVFAANIPSEIAGNCHWKIVQSENPKEDYTRVLKCSEERRFLDFSHYEYNSSKPFGKGSGESEWFPRHDGNSEGIQRRYDQKRALVSQWHVSAWTWECDPAHDVHIPTPLFVPCQHHSCAGHTGRGQCDRGSDRLEAQHLWEDEYYIGQRARPRVLTQSYFGGVGRNGGTITVLLRCANQNPWAPILGSAIRGLFSAFNIGGNIHPLYTVCFASAKAGYKNKLNWNNKKDIEDNRAYRVDWQNEEEWNLCQSDWDAVLIPVRRAESLAKGRRWQGDVGDFLDGYAENDLGVSAGNMKSGGTKEMTLSNWRDGNGRNLPPDYYRFGRLRGHAGWGDLPIGTTWDWEDGDVTTEWQIERKNQPIDWGGLQKVMFH